MYSLKNIYNKLTYEICGSEKLAHSLGESEVSAYICDWNRLENLRLLLTHSVPYLIDVYRRLFLLCRIV